MTALITGVSGQDGTYLAELISAKDVKVLGVCRDIAKAKATIPEVLQNKMQLVKLNLLSQTEVSETIANHRPTQIFNFAAYSTGAGMYDDPLGMGEINGLAVTRILEAIRMIDPTIRFCQASSREIFGEAVESPQSESTVINPRSPYGAAKLYADNMIRIYRQRYGLFACAAILFNHESPRRGLAFVTRKITHTAAQIKLGLANELRLGNLDARRDWGFAGDTVRAMWLMLQQARADDYVVATGETHSVREFCDVAFGYLGLNYRNYVREDAGEFRPQEPALLVGDAAKARRELGWKPMVSFKEMVGMMVDADLQALKSSMV